MSEHSGWWADTSVHWDQVGRQLLPMTLRRTRLEFLSAFLAVSFVATVACLEIVSTYQVFSGTADEPATIAAGVEWLDRGTYNLDNTHPPLSRIAVGAGLYLHGSRLPMDSDDWRKVGNEILYANNEYTRNLMFARVGILPFFLLATGAVWIWARKAIGETGGWVAVLLFTLLPPILAHAGMATTDLAVTAIFVAASLAGMYWLEQPTYARSCVLGIAAGLAALTKFSAILFLPVSGVVMLACFVLDKKRGTEFSNGWRRKAVMLALTGLVGFLVIWAGYRFSYRMLDTGTRPHEAIDRFLVTHPAIQQFAHAVARHVPVPAPELIKGIEFQKWHNARGSGSYLFGEAKRGGWWYFFPVVLAVKSPLPFLILALVGFFALFLSDLRRVDWRVLAAATMAVIMLIAAMPSNINLGVRQILPIYPLLAVIAAFGAVRLWKVPRPKFAGPALAIVLLVWQIVSCSRAYPDYLAYFNALAGTSPERISVGSDLDWGQDLFRLSDVLRARHIDSFSIAFLGSADLSRHNLPHFTVLRPFQPTTGWIAISLTRLVRGDTEPPYYGYSWLRSCRPVERVGKSIMLYYVQPSDCSDRGAVTCCNE